MACDAEIPAGCDGVGGFLRAAVRDQNEELAGQRREAIEAAQRADGE